MYTGKPLVFQDGDGTRCMVRVIRSQTLTQKEDRQTDPQALSKPFENMPGTEVCSIGMEQGMEQGYGTHKAMHIQ